MTPAEAIAIAQALSLIIRVVGDAVNQAKRSGEWSEDEEAEVDAQFEEAFDSPHWRN